MPRKPLILLLFLALALAGCKPGGVTVSGTVTYRERIALPPAAMVRVSIEDVSLADQTGKPIASAAFRPARMQVPIAYAVTVTNPGVIDPKHQYGLRVRIEDGNGGLMFINDTRYGVITNGVLRQDVVVKRVAAP